VDADGNVLAFRGRALEPPVSVPAGLTNAAIDANGVITALDDTGARQQIGQLTMARFVNPQGLEALGDGLFRETVNSGERFDGTPGDGTFDILAVGALEGSNVNMAEEFTNIIIAQRAYEACAKTFHIGDQMLELATNLTQ
jgi:flagellar hook-basal body protein